MDPSRRLIRAIDCEQIHLAWYDPDVAAEFFDEVDQARESAARSATGEQAATDAAWHFDLAAGQGAGVLADLPPQAASLPFDVVTVPLNDLDEGPSGGEALRGSCKPGDERWPLHGDPDRAAR